MPLSRFDWLSSDDRLPGAVLPGVCFVGASGWPCRLSIGPDELVLWIESRIAAIREEMLVLLDNADACAASDADSVALGAGADVAVGAGVGTPVDVGGAACVSLDGVGSALDVAWPGAGGVPLVAAGIEGV